MLCCVCDKSLKIFDSDAEQQKHAANRPRRILNVVDFIAEASNTHSKQISEFKIIAKDTEALRKTSRTLNQNLYSEIAFLMDSVLECR